MSDTFKSSSQLDFLQGGGEMGARMRSFDWKNHPLGPPENWPQSLKIVIRIMLTSRYAMWLGWGPEFYFFCNDAYLPTVGIKESWVLGESARKVWAEIWQDIGPRAESVVTTGEATWDEGLMLFLERSGYVEETYHTFSYSPVPDDAGGIGGMLCVVTEETERIIGERRLDLLRELASDLAAINTEQELFDAVRNRLQIQPADLPVALIYLFDSDNDIAQLACAHGTDVGVSIAPEIIDLRSGEQVWPASQVLIQGNHTAIVELDSRFGLIPSGPWDRPPRIAAIVPIARQGVERPAGFLVAALNPYRPYDTAYSGFIDLLAGQIAAALANIRVYEEERKRAEALAELDRAKTTFFSNVSHEFRTPLTLMLGPLEDILAKPADQVLPENREMLTVVSRNGQRLLKLVNTLLDFSRIEAGRMQAVYEPVNLAGLTADLASVFRSAVEKAGMQLRIDTPALTQPVYVDRDMWEKIVLNLVSNAFKYTLEGEIRVQLREEDGAAVLSIEDTGIGIPTDELPNLFNRFHRVEGARGRTQEGTGIGLALVQELIRLHGGDVSVQSTVGKGSTFTVTVPFGTEHIPADRIGGERVLTSTAVGADSFVEEALRWLPDEAQESTGLISGTGADVFIHSDSGSNKKRATVVLADDNADMRDYVRRLLSSTYNVIAVNDGAEALEAARRHIPDLVVTDVMMPNLDGFGLLHALRADSTTASIPVVMLSARAGEEARVEGLKAGADDYLTKPFSARELLARIEALLELMRVRQEAAEAVLESEERFRYMADSAPVIIWVTEADGYCSYLSRSWYEFTGQTPETGLGFGWLNALHVDDRQMVQDTFLTANAQQQAFRMEYRMMRFDGEYAAWGLVTAVPRFTSDGIFLGYIGSVIDITDRKQAESVLRSSEKQLRTLANALPQLAWMARADGYIFWYNQRWYDYTGTTLEEMEGWGWQKVHDPDELPRVLVKIKRSFEDGTPWEDTFPLRRFDGEMRWHLSRMMPVRDDDGNITLWLGTNTDISEQRDADKRKDEFLATLAHELRNPLAPLRSGLELLRMIGSPDSTVEDVHQMMERQMSQMVRLIDDLLDVSRISRNRLELRTEPVQLSAVINSAIETSRPLIEQSRHNLAVSIPDGSIIVNADMTRLAQIFSNLLNNAAKYTPAGGDIQMSVSLEGNWVAVSVRDNGIGIPQSMLPRIFEMFTQVDRSLERSYGGLGIGLTLVQRLVEMHGGTITAYSDGDGAGSEFIVRLPVVSTATEKPQNSGSDVQQEQDASKPAHRILVVDDNQDSATMLATMLSMRGNETRTEHDGESAVKAASEFRPDIMLLDIGMPKMNGYDVARHVREQEWGKNIVLVALTGWGQEEDRRRSKEAGFDHHLLKPVEPKVLEKLLEEVASGE